MSETSHPRLIMVGLGGLGTELLDYIRSECSASDHRKPPMKTCLPASTAFFYLDDRDLQLVGEPLGIHRIGSVDCYTPQTGDQLLIAVGNPNARLQLWRKLRTKSSEFGSYIHQTAFVSPTARLGTGVIIGPMATVNCNAVVGNNVFINCYASVAHGAEVGEHSVLSPYATVLGDASVGSECLLATRATVFPQVKVGDRCTIDAHSFAKLDVPDDHIVRCQTEYQVIYNRLSQSERKL